MSSEIKTFLYTKGKEYSLKGSEYIGYYHLFFNTPYSGAEHSADSKKLYPYRNFNPAAMQYDYIKPEFVKLATFIKPYYSTVKVSAAQYRAGKITRYFLKRINENAIYEIDGKMARKYGVRGGFDDMLYQMVKMEWKVSPNGVNNEILVFNRRSVQKAELEMPGIKNIIRTYYEYSVVDIIP